MQRDLRQLRSIVRDLTRGEMSDTRRLAFARAFAAAALSMYWQHTCPGAPGLEAPKATAKLDEHQAREAERIGQQYATMEKPTAAYLLSTLYTLLLPDKMRSEQGVFFTPPPMVDRLLDLVEGAGIDWTQDSAIDPAAGGGAFVSPVAVRMAATLRAQGRTAAEIVDHIATHVAGVELDPFSGWMAHVFLEVALWEVCAEAGKRIPRVIVSADSLRHRFGQRRYRLVIGNPPYGRITLEKSQRERFARSLYGHANLYGLFTDLAVQLCQPGGVIGYVTPASFLGGQYFKNLRALLAAEAPPLAIDFIADRAGVFDKVLQETVLIVLGRGNEQGPVSVHTTQPFGLGSTCEVTPSGDFPLPQDPHAPWLLPRRAEDVELLHALEGMPHRLSDYGLAVSTGPLVWNRHKPQLADRRGRNRYPLVWAESVLPSGEFRFSAKKRNHKPYFTWEPGQDHLLTRQSVVLVQRTTAKEQHRRLIAALLPQEFIETNGAAVVENHLNMIYPTNGANLVNLQAVTVLLNSAVIDKIFRCINGSVAVSAFELESLPLPPPEIMDELETMLENGAEAGAIECFLSNVYHAGAVEVAA